MAHPVHHRASAAAEADLQLDLVAVGMLAHAAARGDGLKAHGVAREAGAGRIELRVGVTVGGQMYQKFGLTQDYWLLTGSKEVELFKGRDKGRFQDTKNEADAFIFKVQQLRNVAVTPPYFHDGSVAELKDAVRIMAKLQLGRDLTKDDTADIVAFLESLTGEVPAEFANVPMLPAASYRN